MLRPLAVVVAGILLSRPDLPPEQAERLGRVLQREAQEHDFDPLTGIAMIHFESGWRADAISPNGEDYGLGQIRARFIGACRQDRDPLHGPSAECQAVKSSLLDPEKNLEVMAELISNSRALCRKKAGSVALSRWLAAYQGLNFPKQRRWCQPGPKTWRVIQYRGWLLRELPKRVRQGRARRP